MNKKNLIILSGGGDPTKTRYKHAYNLICKYSKEYRYDKIKIVKWPGHLSRQDGLSLDFDNAVTEAEREMDLFNKHEESFDLIARSFGCVVSLKILQKAQYEYLERIVLWGLPPYYTNYIYFKENYNSTYDKMLSKGLKVSKIFIDTLPPNESLIKNINKQYNGKIKFGTGDQDEVCTPGYLIYLKTDFPELHEETFTIIPNVGHVIIEDNKEYRKFLFE